MAEETRRGKVLRQVAALLAQADSTTFSAERDTFIEHADKLMVKFAIETFELEMARPLGERAGPEMRDFSYGTTGNSEADEQLAGIFYALAEHLRCLVGVYGWKMSKVVGYPADLDFLAMLFFNIRVHLATKLEPKPDPHLSYLDNLVILKESGLKWVRIYELMYEAFPSEFLNTHTEEQWMYPPGKYVKVQVPNEGPHWERKIGVKFTKQYHDFCVAQGREQRYTNPDVWRRNFILGYTSEVKRRIQRMTAQNEKDTGGALVLVSMHDVLQEFLWDTFPRLRPHPKGCQCDSCHYIRCHDATCTRPRCVQGRLPVKPYKGRQVRDLMYDGAAAAAGAQAGQSVDLTSSSQKVGTRPSGEISG